LPLAPPVRRDVPSGRFGLFYTPRHCARGRNPGLTGVADVRLIDAYAEGLGRTVRLLEGHAWAPPKPDPESGCVEVYVGDLAASVGITFPFTFYYDNIYKKYTTFIGLLSESSEVSVEAMLDRARHDASHEGVHAYTHSWKRLDDFAYDNWGWFDEGTAVFGEWDLYPDSLERLRYAGSWVHFPERGLERKGRSVGYETAWFIHYLVARKGGWVFLRRVWEEAQRDEGPIQTIDRLFREAGETFRDATADVEDFFGAGYCVESYLTAALCPRLHDRYGDRMTSGGFEPEPGRPESFDETLGPMACRYYRIAPCPGAAGFRAEIEGLGPAAAHALKGRVFGVAGGGRHGDVQPLLWKGHGDAARLACDVDPLPGADTYVLVVANVLSVTDLLDVTPTRPTPGVLSNTTAFRLTVSA
jgi:hypothetical protein